MPENFINGDWVSARAGGRRSIRCPATGELVAEIDESTAVDTEAAIGAARSAFDEGPWPRTSARERGELLLRVAELLQRDRDQLARMESLDTGKRLPESEIDIDDVTSVFRHFGLVADAQAGRVVDTGRDDVVSRIVHEPVGVCGLISRPASSVSHGDAPSQANDGGSAYVVSTAVVYAPSPTNAAWPNDVSPPTPVSNTRPSATSAYSPM